MLRQEWLELNDKILRVHEVNCPYFKGKVGFLIFGDKQNKVYVDTPSGRHLIADKDIVWVQLAPYDNNWWATIMFDKGANIFEAYIDISQNYFDEEEPYFTDYFLDITFNEDYEIVVLDQDELDKALEENVIDEKIYNLVLQTKNKLLYYLDGNVPAIKNFLEELYIQWQLSLLH